MTLAFRPALLPQDQQLLAALFTASVLQLGADDYGEDELAAWAAVAEDVEAFGTRLAPMLTLVALQSGQPAGFVALKDNRVIDMLYVGPDYAGQGVGTAMIRAIETLATHRGAKDLSVDASDMAKPLFEKLGYVAQRRNTVHVAGVWLANTTLTKAISKEQPGRN